MVHGGLYATVAESVASVLRPMTSGRLSMTAAPIIQGQREQLWEVTMSRADGKPVARSRVRLRNIDLPRVDATAPR